MRLSPSSPCSSMRSISDNQMIQKSLPVYDREGYFDLGGSAFMIRAYSVSEKRKGHSRGVGMSCEKEYRYDLI